MRPHGTHKPCSDYQEHAPRPVDRAARAPENSGEDGPTCEGDHLACGAAQTDLATTVRRSHP